jgi:hypothetical protein
MFSIIDSHRNSPLRLTMMLVWIIAAQLTDAGDRKELEENQLVT